MASIESKFEKTRLHAQAQVKHRQEVIKSMVEEVGKGNVKGSTNLQEDSINEIPPWTNFLTINYPDFYG